MRTLIIISISIIAVLFLVKFLFPKSSKAATIKAGDLAKQSKDKVIEVKQATIQKLNELDEKLATKLA